MGERYRREMLAHGGAKEPMLMVEGSFLYTTCFLTYKLKESLLTMKASQFRDLAQKSSDLTELRRCAPHSTRWIMQCTLRENNRTSICPWCPQLFVCTFEMKCNWGLTSLAEVEVEVEDHLRGISVLAWLCHRAEAAVSLLVMFWSKLFTAVAVVVWPSVCSSVHGGTYLLL